MKEASATAVGGRLMNNDEYLNNLELQDLLHRIVMPYIGMEETNNRWILTI